MKIYKKISRPVFLLLILIVSIVFTACPAPSSNLVDTGSEPYQKPYVPKNVEATCGEHETITISWDPVDGVNLYIIEGIASSEFGVGQMEEYARTTETSYTFYLNGAGDGQPYRNFDASESYIFSVKSYVNFGTASDYLISDSSDYAEGCFAPPSIEFHASVTKNSLNLYWNLSNIYSVLSTGSTPEPLYNPDFTIEYRKAGDSNWTQITQEQYGGKDPWMFASLNVSEYKLEHDAEYDFRITMNLAENVVNPTTLQSSVFTSKISDDLSVNSVENLSATQGTLSDRIELTWGIPSWSQGATRDNSYFAVYRSEGTDINNAEVLVNEIEDNEHSSDITADGNVIKFIDDTVAPKKTYHYWVVNAAKDLDGLLHEQTVDEIKDKAVKGFIFYPDISNLNGTFEVDTAGKTATYSLKWDNNSSQFPDDLTLAIERSVWHSRYDRTVVDYEITLQDSAKEYSGIESSTCTLEDDCTNQHRYSYNLVILKDGKKFYDLGSFGLSNAVLGTMSDMAFTDFTASNDYVDIIRISWKPTEGHTGVSYSYEIDGTGQKQNITPASGENGILYHDIAISDDKEHSIILYAGEYESPEARQGKRLVVEEGVEATDGTSNDSIYITWESFEPLNSNITYVMIASNNDGENVLGEIRPQDGIYVVEKSNEIKDKGEKYNFRIAAYNKIQSNSSYAYGESDEGYIIPVPELLSVSKGEYSDKVEITWDASISDMIDGYRIYRSSSSDMSEGVEIDVTLSATASSYEDTLPDRYEEYYYGVVSIKNGVKSRFLTSDEIGKKQNILFEDEAINLGYAFDTSLGDVTVTESIEDVTGFISDYFIVSVPANKTSSTYVISSTHGADESFNMNDLVKKSESTLYYREGYKSTDVGYFQYDSETEILSFNSKIGTVDSTLTISEISVQGKNDSELYTNESEISGSFRRGLHEYDYISLFNDAFKNAINSSYSKTSDWWEDYSTQLIHEEEKTGNGLRYMRVYGASQHAGHIYFTGYSYNSLLYLTGTSDSKILVLAYNDGDAGNLGTDPLDTIGHSEDSNSTDIKMTVNNMLINGHQVKYKDAAITVKNVVVREASEKHGTGHYDVTINGGKVIPVDITNSNIDYLTMLP